MEMQAASLQVTSGTQAPSCFMMSSILLQDPCGLLVACNEYRQTQLIGELINRHADTYDTAISIRGVVGASQDAVCPEQRPPLSQVQSHRGIRRVCIHVDEYRIRPELPLSPHLWHSEGELAHKRIPSLRLWHVMENVAQALIPTLLVCIISILRPIIPSSKVNVRINQKHHTLRPCPQEVKSPASVANTKEDAKPVLKRLL
mmetsp:Transcript_57432/g.106086  ORF Transcript_57432/g.106086 Transcript_57432/m.106086 type:complete len:202 (-) Transcript_57432:88-693(-)